MLEELYIILGLDCLAKQYYGALMDYNPQMGDRELITSMLGDVLDLLDRRIESLPTSLQEQLSENIWDKETRQRIWQSLS